jgi:multiple sugar transport system permease protein
MRGKTFALFVAPSLAMMLIFIAMPLISVFWQSFHETRAVVTRSEVESCSPGFLAPTCTREMRTVPKIGPDGKPMTETVFVGLDVYRRVLQTDAVARAFAPGGGGISTLLGIDFWKALRFTLTFTLITLPLVIGLGLLIALAVNNLVKALRGPAIFITLLPFIVTPVIGALSIRWLFLGDGILTRGIEWVLARDISMFAQGWTIEIMMLIYKVWHVAPFAFVVFYAALQTVDQDTLESAIVDGASRLERLRYVVIPHLMPLIVFVALIHLMDSYRVFDEIVGFSAQAHVLSLQYLTYSFLTPDETGNRAVARAAASSMLTMIGIVILLVPLLMRTWRTHRAARR